MFHKFGGESYYCWTVVIPFVVEKYHFVCHECAAEEIVGTQDEAKALLSEHATETEHEGQYADVGE